MGTITSGVGLISGLDYQSIVDQLMAIEARPRNRLLARVGNLDAQRTAYLDISARITALLSRVSLLTRPNTFRAVTAKSSLPDVLSATASAGALPGTYSFVVRALAATYQSVSRGFHDRAAPLNTGTLTIESALARVNNSTGLAELNGHTGVRRGSIKIINQAGQQAIVSLGDALTVGEVLEKINAAGIGVQAAVRGDGLVLTDTSTGNGALRVQEVGGGYTAADLGFGAGHTSGTEGVLAGSAVIYLSDATPIAALNDGLGLRHAVAGGDFSIGTGETSFSVDLSDVLKHDTRLERLNHGQGVRAGRIRITSKDRTMAEVDLSSAKTINDVKQAIEAAFGNGRLSVVLTGSRLIVNDSTDTSKLAEDQKSDLIIEDLTGQAAHDLGIDDRSTQGKIEGRDILHMETLADVINAVNYATGNEGADQQPLITASIATDRHGLVLRSTSGAFTLTAPEGGSSKALSDLGLQAGTYEDPGGGAEAVGTRIVGGLDTVLLKTLNGGTGFSGSTLRIEANGKTANLDLSGAKTLADVMDLINGATDGSEELGIEAAYDVTGTRLVVNNTAADTAITISGDFAESIGLAQTGAVLRSANLQRQYTSEATGLEALNAGRGIARGRFKITNSRGVYGTVDLAPASVKTLQDVIDAINGLNIGVTAGINATGDGLLITDTAGGAGVLKIEEDGGTTARDLNILGPVKNGQIDGAFEFKFDIGGSDTLESLVSRINSQTTLARATVLNDGTSIAPYRLSIAALVSGVAGELIIDDGATELGVTTLSRAQDARIFFGHSSDTGILLTSSDNTFENVVDGLTFTANSVDDKPVTITVARDSESLVTALKGLVDDYNSVRDRISQAEAYDSEKQILGILQGEGTLQMIEQRLYRMFTGVVPAGGAITRLSQLGLTIGNGGRLVFDEDKFHAVLAANPEAVERFFTDTDQGVALQIKKQIEAITDTGGLIERRTEALQGRKDLLEKRVEALNEQLDRKRARLLREFQAMEAALAQMQSQQQALSGLAAMLPSFFGSNTTGQR